MTESDKVISYADLQTLLQNGTPDLTVIDVRTPEEVARGRSPDQSTFQWTLCRALCLLDPASFSAKWSGEAP
ncbi:thiosulfate:glutathione sulfurtransferase-like [Huso huso]|uniref:Thiosulfate:glutathione sulfurtransferase-like n=1 Tax=Huso huso TaxID=61971 RepID=A0ABR0Y3B1_HUSHU